MKISDKVNTTVSAAANEKSSATNIYKTITKVVDTVSETELIAKTREQYVSDFKREMKTTAKATLEMCRTVYEASKTLNSADFESFCRDVGYKDDSSTIRKFIVIGKVYPRLIEYAEQLPVGWTSIYQLTQISAEDFDKCVKSKYALNKLSGSELKQLIDKTRDLNDTLSPFKQDKKTLNMKIGEVFFTKKIDDTDWRLIEKAFDEVCSRLPVKIRLVKGAEELFAARRQKLYDKLKKEDVDVAVKPHLWDYGSTVNKVTANGNALLEKAA
jgi:hypothetical protein